MIIDAWMQHPNADWIGNPMFESLRRWRPGKWSETAPPIEDTLAEMDRAGVSVGMLCAWHGPGGPMISNDEVAQYCRAYPDRFIGIASVDLFRPMEAVRELRLRVKRDGFKGLRVLPWVWGLPPDDCRYYPLFAECCELDVPIMMQIGHCLDYQRDRILPSVGRPITLDRVAIDFPELKLIGIHLGWPWTDEMIAVCFKHANVYMAGDAYAPKHWPAEYVRYVDSWGQDKCLFGTDWPVIDPERAIHEIDQLNLRSASRSKLLRENAMRVFRLEEHPETPHLATNNTLTAPTERP